jgi:hypothetical protein
MENKKNSLVVSFAGLLLAACASAPGDSLTGEWQTADGEMTLRFFEDGGFAAAAPRGETRGLYDLADHGRVTMSFEGLEATVAVSVSGSRLLFCQEGDRCYEFRRMR